MGESESAAIPAIPADGLLLHIGVFKTGTTALQETLRHSPEVLSGADVLYRGPSTWKFAPLRSLAQSDSAQWRDLVQDVAEHAGRVIVSSENLCGSSDGEAAAIVRQLSGERPVRILITIRSLAELLPSTWQQFLKRGMSQPYEDWLKNVVADAASGSDPFWRRNDFAGQVRRWGGLVGPGNVTLVVSDKRKPDRLLRITEQFLALPEGSLQFHPAGKTNQSLSHAEAELLRRVNEATFESLGEAEYHRLVRLGVFPGMHRSQQSKAAPIPLPDWAADEMERIGHDQAAALAASGAEVIGDLAALAQRPPDVAREQGAPDTISMDAAAAAVIGALNATKRQPASPAATPPAKRSLRSRLGARLRRLS